MMPTPRQDATVRVQDASVEGHRDLRDRELARGDGYGGAQVQARRDLQREILDDAVAEGIEGRDPSRRRPLGKRADLHHRLVIGIVRMVIGREGAGGDRQAAVGGTADHMQPMAFRPGAGAVTTGPRTRAQDAPHFRAVGVVMGSVFRQRRYWLR